MRSLLKIWGFLVLGALIAVVVQKDSGYVLLSYDVWTIEMSLALLALLVLAGFALLYFIIRLVINTWQIPSEVRAWNHRRGARLARRSLTRGLLEMSEGKWIQAEKNLIKHASRSETPLLNYLAAARAAQLQAQHERRDAYIRLAHESMPAADVAVSLTQAELQLADHQLEQALATLKHLRSVAPKHTYVLRLLRRLYEQLGDWDHLKELIPELRRRKVEPANDLKTLEIKVQLALLDRASMSVEKTVLTNVWNEIPKKLRQETRLVADYTGYLQERGKDEEAEKLLRDALKQEWSESLMELYGLLNTEQPGKLLSTAETFIKQNPNNPVLLLALGRLSLRSKLWGKARGYLEACIGADGPTDAYRELARLLEQMGETEGAMNIYRQGLTDREDYKPIPLPESLRPNTITQVQLNQDEDADSATTAPHAPPGAKPITSPF